MTQGSDTTKISSKKRGGLRHYEFGFARESGLDRCLFKIYGNKLQAYQMWIAGLLELSREVWLESRPELARLFEDAEIVTMLPVDFALVKSSSSMFILKPWHRGRLGCSVFQIMWPERSSEVLSMLERMHKELSMFGDYNMLTNSRSKGSLLEYLGDCMTLTADITGFCKQDFLAGSKCTSDTQDNGPSQALMDQTAEQDSEKKAGSE